MFKKRCALRIEGEGFRLAPICVFVLELVRLLVDLLHIAHQAACEVTPPVLLATVDEAFLRRARLAISIDSDPAYLLLRLALAPAHTSMIDTWTRACTACLLTYAWMRAWMHGCMRCMDAGTDECMHACIHGRMDSACMCKQVHTQARTPPRGIVCLKSEAFDKESLHPVLDFTDRPLQLVPSIEHSIEHFIEHSIYERRVRPQSSTSAIEPFSSGKPQVIYSPRLYIAPGYISPGYI